MVSHDKTLETVELAFPGSHSGQEGNFQIVTGLDRARSSINCGVDPGGDIFHLGGEFFSQRWKERCEVVRSCHKVKPSVSGWLYCHPLSIGRAGLRGREGGGWGVVMERSLGGRGMWRVLSPVLSRSGG